MTNFLTANDATIGQQYDLISTNRGDKLRVKVEQETETVLLGGATVYDDFLSGAELSGVGAGTQIRSGLGDTNWTGVFINTTGQVFGDQGASTPANARGVSQLSTGNPAAGSLAACIRGSGPLDITPCRIGQVRRLDFLVSLLAQDSATSGLVHDLGFATEFDGSAPAFMVIHRQTPIASNPNWTIARTGLAAIDTGIPAASNTTYFFRLQQRQDLGTGLGSGVWDFFLGPDLESPVVSGFDGGGLGGVPSSATNYGIQVIKNLAPGVASQISIDAIGEEFFPLTFAQRIAG